MTNRIGHRVIAISRIFLKDQWKFLPWWLLSKSEYNGNYFPNSKLCTSPSIINAYQRCKGQKKGQEAASIVAFDPFGRLGEK